MAKKQVLAAKKPAKAPKPMSPEREKLITRFHGLIQGFPGATQRITFGSPAYYINGQMFTALHGDSMILRLPPADLEGFMKLDGARPFEPMPGRPMKGWASVPASLQEDEDTLRPWLEKAYEYVKVLPPKKK